MADTKMPEPTPWVLGGMSGRMITTPSGYVGDGFIADVDTLANAALIVHAVNSLASHEARIAELEGALRDLCLAYVNLLEIGRDRIVMLGGECDQVDVMEKADPQLAAARRALHTEGENNG